MLQLDGICAAEASKYFFDTLTLLKTVEKAELVTLNNLKPNEPVFVIHQTNTYPDEARPLVGLRVVGSSTDYTFANGETYHYFGAFTMSGNTKYYCCQLMAFMPSGSSMTLDFNPTYPMSANRRCLIFQ